MAQRRLPPRKRFNIGISKPTFTQVIPCADHRPASYLLCDPSISESPTPKPIIVITLTTHATSTTATVVAVIVTTQVARLFPLVDGTTWPIQPSSLDASWRLPLTQPSILLIFVSQRIQRVVFHVRHLSV